MEDAIKIPVFKSEIQMQAWCCTWFWNTYKWTDEARMLHCNMNNSFNSIAGSTAKAMGVVAGVSDVEFVDWKIMWFLEFKMPGGIQSEEQIEFQDRVERRGHQYLIIYSAEQFMKFIHKRLYHGTLGDSC